MSTEPTTLDGFLEKYTGDREVIELNLPDAYVPGKTPFIVIRHLGHVVVVSPMGFADHLSVDVHPFKDGEKATAGVLAMTEGQTFKLQGSKTTSHGWESAALVAVLVGKQDTKKEDS